MPLMSALFAAAFVDQVLEVSMSSHHAAVAVPPVCAPA
jgi:hypothetical protein